MTKPTPVPPRGRSALGALTGSVPPVHDEPSVPEYCGKPTMAQNAKGDWLPCHREPGHEGGCG